MRRPMRKREDVVARVAFYLECLVWSQAEEASE